MPELPLLLAGPIVRRVDIETCAIWIALSEPASVTISIWEGTQMAGASPGTVDDGRSPTAQSAAIPLQKYGPHLYIGVIQFEIVPTFTPGAIYSYDVVVSGAMGTMGLKALGLLVNAPATEHTPGHLALGYVDDRLPSFVAQPAVISQVSFMHASCRKSNGVGPDALAWLDDQLELHYANLANGKPRPQQLFLTGDQIYADDVGA